MNLMKGDWTIELTITSFLIVIKETEKISLEGAATSSWLELRQPAERRLCILYNEPLL